MLSRCAIGLALFAAVVAIAARTGSADDGDTLPPQGVALTDPAVTKHDTTFDNLQPPVPLDPNNAPPGGYIPTVPVQCTLPGTGIFDQQWRLVGNDDPVTLEGQVTSSKLAWDDNQADHHSRDRNFFVFPDLAYAHLLSFGNFSIGEANEIGRMEVEWESAAFPAWALPTAGDRVHVEGSHIWDCAHGENGRYRTEIHPPRLLMTLRDAADEQWSNGTGTIPPRPGWVDTMPGLGSVPVPVTRADVFGSSDGGEAREQLTCFHAAALPPPPGCPPDWYQELRAKQYDLFVPAPPRPDPDAQLVTKLVPRPFLTCNSDDGCGGALDELASHPERFTFTNENGLFDPGVQIHIDLAGDEPASLLYGFGFTFEVGWNRPAVTIPQRFKVTVQSVHLDWLLDGPCIACAPGQEDGEYEISALIGDTFRHLRLAGGPKAPSYDSHQDVPDTEDLNVGDYAIKTTGSCGLDAPSGSDTSPCGNTFHLTLLPGEPLRVFFRAEEHDFLSENDEAGSVELIATAAQNYGIGQHTQWFQERSSAGDDAMHPECGLPATPCLSVTYTIEADPIPAPPSTILSAGVPSVFQSGDTWVSAATPVTLLATAPSGHAGDALDVHARFWRANTAAPPEAVCGSGTGTATCTLHLNANDGLDGHYTVEYWTVDTTTGAVEQTRTEELRLDTTPPTTGAFPSGTFLRGWYSSPVTVALLSTDPGGVGVGFTTYTVDGGASATYSAPFAVSGDSASHTVSFSSQDKLANAEAAKSIQFKIDSTPPTLTVADAFDGTFHYTQNELVGGLFTNAGSLTVAYTASDALSGMWDVRIDGASVPFGGTKAIPLPAGVSTHTLVAEDVAGNLATLTFAVVSVTPLATPDPQGAGYWKNSSTLPSSLLDGVNVASRAFGSPTNRYDDVTTSNYQSFLSVSPNSDVDLKVRRELLVAWLNLVSGREAAAQKVDLRSVSGWPNVVTNTNGSSVTTALNLVRESERRLEDVPATPFLANVHALLEKLNSGGLNKK